MVIDLQWEAQLSAQDVWQREAIVLEVRAKGTGLSSFAHLKTKVLKIPNMDVIPLPAKNEQRGKEDHRELSLRWKLIPHSSGLQNIHLKEIYYMLNGGKQKKWQPEPLQLDVRALPPYLPPTFPVGEIEMSSHYEKEGWLNPGGLVIWHLKIASDTVSQAQFPAVIRQISEANDVDVLPAKTSLNTTESGRFIMDYIIPLKPKSSGRLAIPELQWQWFDPKTAKLQKDHYQPARPWVLAWWQRILIGLSSLLLLSLIARQIYLLERKRSRRWQTRKQVWQAISSQQNIDVAMRECAEAHGWPNNLSIQQWLERWTETIGYDQNLSDALQSYEQQKFSK
ncbi:MAG: Oxygen tolerance [uncultured Thiotrichaceae bacterium]|uniref:Oxygen tolerance n=1 Tax=uncultured Thiotrichaceae bacterium TaxID=298394 RepID=A0A6S6T5A1_9GAMM|nr:MAG: Oxygen tolerance [uncultured Thiotrichaceae bacterium]